MESRKVSSGKKSCSYFIGYKDNEKVKPLCKIFQKLSQYRKIFKETIIRHFSINCYKNIIKPWIKSAIVLKKGFDSEPVYNEKYLKIKIKSYEGKISTNFHDDRIPNEGSHCAILSVILIDSLFEPCKNYYPQVFLEERKHIVQEKKLTRYITDNLQ